MTKKKTETKAETTPDKTATGEKQHQDTVMDNEAGNSESEKAEATEEAEDTPAEKNVNTNESEGPEAEKAEIPEDLKPQVSVPGMEKYFEAYPENNVFYRTSDGQVFLEKNKHLALDHQRRQKKGELETIKRP